MKVGCKCFIFAKQNNLKFYEWEIQQYRHQNKCNSFANVKKQKHEASLPE